MNEQKLTNEQAQHMRRSMWKWGNTLYFIQRKEREIRQFQDAINDAYETLHAQQVTDMPKGGNTGASSVERAVIAAQHRAEQFEVALASIQREIDQALAIKQAIDEAIAGMDAVDQKILAMRYIDEHQWSYIGLRLNYDERWVRNKEYNALCKLSRVLNLRD